jgi:hypothetical protein
MSDPRTYTPRDPEKGAALIVALVALVALLGIGGVTILAVQSETRSSGSDRFTQAAMYAAESGAAAGMEYIRNNCSITDLFSDFVEPNNVNPQKPADLFGNMKQPGDAQNPFTAGSQLWYEVTLLNNPGDGGFTLGEDHDGIIMLQIVGHGPNGAQATLQLDLQNTLCLANFCEIEFAQRGVTSRNDAVAACSAQVESAQTQTIVPPGN